MKTLLKIVILNLKIGETHRLMENAIILAL
jgi:hypothetical protein